MQNETRVAGDRVAGDRQYIVVFNETRKHWLPVLQSIAPGTTS